MQIFPVKIIPAAADAQWAPPEMADASGKKLLVISKPITPGSREEDTLQKMMAACRLQPSEYEILSMEDGRRSSWQAIAAMGTPRIILLLGITLEDLSIHALFRLYAPNDFCGKIFIVSAALSDLERDVAAKKALWTEGLKPAFGL